jgi:Protein of Unknown function (DUF2784)
MPSTIPYRLLADTVLVLHLAIVLFVVGGLVLVVVGNFAKWRWVNGLWFRWVHLAAIGVVVAQALLGVACPLTTLEVWLRAQAQMGVYSRGFIEHWVHSLLFYTAPPWVFTLIYSVFGLLVWVAWVVFPPRFKR